MKDQSLLVRYPIGMFEYGKEYSNLDTLRHIREIADLPKKLKKIVKKLREGALDKTYRQHGWTVRQVVHHLADSHINAYVRMKLAVTENAPIVKPYEEQLWAETEDGKHGSAGMSLKLLSALHKRWVFFLSHLSDEDLDKVYYNPSSKRTIQLREAIALYAWHGKHHLAHVKLVADGNKKHEAGDTDVVEVKAKRSPKLPKAKAVAGQTGKESSGEKEAPKRRGRPPMSKSSASPVKQPGNKRAVAADEKVQDLTRTAADDIAASKDVVTSTPTAAAAKPKRGRPAVGKVASVASLEEKPKMSVEERMAKARAGRQKAAVANPVSEEVVVSSEKPKRGRPAVGKVASVTTLEEKPRMSVEERMAKARAGRQKAAAAKPVSEEVVVSSEKPKRGRPAVNKVAPEATAPEKPKRSRRTPEEIAAAKEKKG